VASGTAADGASARARVHTAGAHGMRLSGRACWHAARLGHHGAAASRRRQWGSAEAIGNGTEVSTACPQMEALAAGRGGAAQGDPTGGPWHGAGQNQCRRLVARTDEVHGGLEKSHEADGRAPRGGE
jgi:hypothetical protein